LVSLQGGGESSVFELSQRFGFEPDLSEDGIQEKLKELQEQIKKKILTEMKIKEGAENLRKVTSDKKKSHVNSIVKEANSKLEDLNEQLQEVNAYLLGTNSHHTPAGGLVD
jgi:protein kinase N